MRKLLTFLVIIVVIMVAILCGPLGKTIFNSIVQEVDDKTINIISPSITFVTNGGSVVDSQKTNLIKEAPVTKREHFLFDGWYLDKDFKALAVFPLSVEYDTTLYAKWLKIYDEKKTNQAIVISGKQDYSSSKTLNVSPSGFDFEELAKKGYLLEITVSFDISYKKKYDVPLDIGYVGAPHYEVCLCGEDLKGAFKEDLTAPKSTTTKTISMCISADYYKNNTISLTFHSNNVQNVIYVENISATYRCGKDSSN